MKKYILLFIAIIIPLLIVVFYYKYYNEDDNLSIQCGLYKLTGFLCPGCGGQRSFYHLLHGHILAALQYNALLVVGLPVFLYLYFVSVKVYIFKDKKYLNSFIFSSTFAYSLLVVFSVYFIIRNIPYEPFTYLTLP